jgi:hypothetical protein
MGIKSNTNEQAAAAMSISCAVARQKAHADSKVKTSKMFPTSFAFLASFLNIMPHDRETQGSQRFLSFNKGHKVAFTAVFQLRCVRSLDLSAAE